MVRPVRSALLGIGLVMLSVAAYPHAQATAPPIARQVDRARLMRDVASLASPAFEGRSPGTSGSLKARQFIVREFQAAGLTAGGTGGFVQSFELPGRSTARASEVRSAGRTAANVIGRIAGRNPQAKSIVVTAHYDHLGIRNGVLYPGADDNASGVAVMLAAARYFGRTQPRHPMMFAALDAEEIGLLGARALIASPLLTPGSIALVVNLDMVSRSTTNEIFAAGTSYSPWLMPLLQDVQRRSAVTIRFGHDRPAALAGGLEDWTQLSDHGAFHSAGVPFVYFGVDDHPDHHGPGDTVARIDTRFFGDTADMILEAVRTFDARIN